MEFNAENKEDNIMVMYNSGFSIIEISKVLDLDVSSVKSFIDSHRGE